MRLVKILLALLWVFFRLALDAFVYIFVTFFPARGGLYQSIIDCSERLVSWLAYIRHTTPPCSSSTNPSLSIFSVFFNGLRRLYHFRIT